MTRRVLVGQGDEKMAVKSNRKGAADAVVLFASGYLRLAPELVAETVGREGSYFIRPYPEEKRIELQPAVNGKKEVWAKRRLLYSNPMAKSPMISVKIALQYIGVGLPETPTEYKAKKKADGTLVIQF